MTPDADLVRALDQVCHAARAHLHAVQAADGDPDDDAVWASYVGLNNASVAYDEMLEQRYGEVTPWDVGEALSINAGETETVAEAGTPDGTGTGTDTEIDEPDGDDLQLSVRQRRDYVVPDIDALLRAGTTARSELWAGIDEERRSEPVRSVGEAVYELLHAGGGSLAGLDVPELLPQSGLVLVNLIDDALGPDDLDTPPHEADDLFALPESPLIFSLYEPVYGSVEEAEEATGQDAP